MTRKNYPEEFKRDAVALYRNTDGATITQIAGELGVSGVTLGAWCTAAGVPIRHRRCRQKDSVDERARTGTGDRRPETAEQELSRLRAENQAFRADKTRLSTERGILRSAAKYFAGETHW
ncbi:transposase [Millisia brevis]|uniref:transposase n=1 Tax=Millisia brevis TaxID=264148 RepID=UPI0008350349|nr:transposase [Millisia brevis]